MCMHCDVSGYRLKLLLLWSLAVFALYDFCYTCVYDSVMVQIGDNWAFP